MWEGWAAALPLGCLQFLWSSLLDRDCCHSIRVLHSSVQCFDALYYATFATALKNHIKIRFFQETLTSDPQPHSPASTLLGLLPGYCSPEVSPWGL